MDSVASRPEGTGGDTASERGDGPPRLSPGRGRALVLVPASPEPKASAGIGRSHGLVAAGVAAVMGLGFVAGTAAFASKPQAVAVAQAPAPAASAVDVLERVQGELRALKASLDGMRAGAEDGREAETIRALKRSVDLLKGDLEGVKAASASVVGQLGAKIDRLDRDPGPKLAEIAARLDRLDREPDAKIAQVATQLAARIDRVERQVASNDTTGAVPAGAAAPLKAPLPPPRAPQPSPTGPAAVPPPHPDAAARAEPPKADPSKPDHVRPEAGPPRPDVPRQEAANQAASRPAALDGWLLRDVYGGVALVEGRAGGLREVAPGEYVPGVGEIRSIERRGRAWVVVTSRGLIQADNRW